MQILITTIYIILGIIAFVIVYQLLVRLVRRFAKFPAPAFIGKFLDSDFRRKLQPPQKIIKDSGMIAGLTTLEVGCGSGAFTIAAARAIGNTGKLYALDIGEDMLKLLRKKMEQPANSDIKNIEILHNSAYEIPLSDKSVDIIFTVTVFQEIPDKQRALAEFKRVLKPDGTLAISEWLFDPDYPWMSTTRKQCEQGGFKLQASHGNTWSYTICFKRENNT